MRQMSCKKLYLLRVACDCNYRPMIYAFYRESRMDGLVEDRSGPVSASPQHISTPLGNELLRLKWSYTLFQITEILENPELGKTKKFKEIKAICTTVLSRSAFANPYLTRR